MTIEPEFNGNDLICTECYVIGNPAHAHYGNWPQFLLQYSITFAIIIAPTLVYLGLVFVIFVASKGKFTAIDTMDLFPLWKYMPEAPYSVEICTSCKKVNCMARIKDQAGQTAIFFHKKYHISDRPKTAEKPQEVKTTQQTETHAETQSILERLAKDETEF